ncbi:family 2 encapsulin nanocompartment cargo protein polyprenyl transferase [Saccharopolyspora sp. TS4A08]|uniref:Family 2 encapsulin nanocompartment cargo protein polyprenyl transferase n=1 Tax=Saccharopolyspora ipomoeae TaxID=3042027 RepID=A0ABT6PW91_9PSEU|nr:family 2 encapsulin nanocompartment cargo protein polyprenyl transferase [Saccharopolyspora sp. TS4A08]MDI2032282.1 family 2 encapsulin nanocompartment cargo protein polyprenyl transferase [Saccharopolyspora sp. TS4A08]
MTAMQQDANRAGQAFEALTSSRTMVEPALRAAVDRLPDRMREVAGYHMGWLDERGDPVRADRGKAMRPAMVVLSASAVGGDPADAVPAAVAVELAHNFSLLHDDVMDGDVTRRHRPTAWTVFGNATAILAGDALLSLAADVLASSRHPESSGAVRMLSSAVLGLIDGQNADLEFETRADVGVAECQRMARDKTGALLGCACALGALYGGGSPEQITRMRSFGERLGLAFQHIDDLLGIWGDPAMTGKPVFSDLRTRKKTLPVVSALTSGTNAGQRLASLYYREQPLISGELAQAAELVTLAGGKAWSQAQADELLAAALSDLRKAEPDEEAAAGLTALAHLVARRDH